MSARLANSPVLGFSTKVDAALVAFTSSKEGTEASKVIFPFLVTSLSWAERDPASRKAVIAISFFISFLFDESILLPFDDQVDTGLREPRPSFRHQIFMPFREADPADEPAILHC